MIRTTKVYEGWLGQHDSPVMVSVDRIHGGVVQVGPNSELYVRVSEVDEHGCSKLTVTTQTEVDKDEEILFLRRALGRIVAASSGGTTRIIAEHALDGFAS